MSGPHHIYGVEESTLVWSRRKHACRQATTSMGTTKIMLRVYAIGDIHGLRRPLRRLIAECERDADGRPMRFLRQSGDGRRALRSALERWRRDCAAGRTPRRMDARGEW